MEVFALLPYFILENVNATPSSIGTPKYDGGKL